MKRQFAMAAFGLAVVSSALFFLGCEADSSADTSLNLNPRSATLKPHQAAVFTVSGGYDYRWTLSSETLGSLNTRVGDQVVYTATSTNGGTQVLTVESYIIGASGNNPTNIMGTNQTVTATTVSATITQVGTGGTSPGTPITSITILPSAPTLTPSDPTVTFNVAEGVAVNWSVQNGSYGDPDTGYGSSFTYIATTFPTSAVTQTIEASYTPSSGATLTKTITVTQKAD